MASEKSHAIIGKYAWGRKAMAMVVDERMRFEDALIPESLASGFCRRCP